jgi:hypothetical protein
LYCDGGAYRLNLTDGTNCEWFDAGKRAFGLGGVLMDYDASSMQICAMSSIDTTASAVWQHVGSVSNSCDRLLITQGDADIKLWSTSKPSTPFQSLWNVPCNVKTVKSKCVATLGGLELVFSVPSAKSKPHIVPLASIVPPRCMEFSDINLQPPILVVLGLRLESTGKYAPSAHLVAIDVDGTAQLVQSYTHPSAK